MTRSPRVPGAWPALGTTGALVAVVLLILVAGFEPRDVGAQRAPRAGPDTPAVQTAARLSAASTASLTLAHPSLTPAQARALARRQARDIPLPAGGSFAGIRWHQADGYLTPGQVEQTLQFNARCQWLRAAQDGRDPRSAHRVAALSRDWPALRGVAGHASPSREITACYASHRRERAFARSRGVSASS